MINHERINGPDIDLERVPFGNNKFFKRLGEALFKAAVRLQKSGVAHADHQGGVWPCWGLNWCHDCQSSAQWSCPGCSPAYLNCYSQNGQDWGQSGHCWYTYVSPYLYICCDYSQNGGYCLCRSSHYV